MSDIKQAEADLTYWQELSDRVPGWRVLGWTYRSAVTYVTPGHWGPESGTIHMTGRQRDDLVAALDLAELDGQTP